MIYITKSMPFSISNWSSLSQYRCLFAAAIVTFMRFFPRLKARYDYGLLIFILTFSLVSVSGYRDDQVLKMAHQRLSTIIVGSCISVIVCICICPVWIGEDLHNFVAANMEKLGNFLEGTKSNIIELRWTNTICLKNDFIILIPPTAKQIFPIPSF